MVESSKAEKDKERRSVSSWREVAFTQTTFISFSSNPSPFFTPSWVSLIDLFRLSCED